MPKLDKLKENLGMYKFWLGLIVGVFTAVAGWIVNNYETKSTLILISASLFLLILIVAFLGINKKIRKTIDEIGNIKK